MTLQAAVATRSIAVVLSAPWRCCAGGSRPAWRTIFVLVILVDAALLPAAGNGNSDPLGYLERHEGVLMHLPSTLLQSGNTKRRVGRNSVCSDPPDRP